MVLRLRDIVSYPFSQSLFSDIKKDLKSETKVLQASDSSTSTLRRLASLGGLLAAFFLFEGSNDSAQPEIPLQSRQPVSTLVKHDPTSVSQQYNYADNFRQFKNFKERDLYLQGLLNDLNPELLPHSSISLERTALSEFNRKNNLSLECIGIKKDPYEFVFIDKNYFLGKSNIPVRIALSYEEVVNVHTKRDVVNLLTEKYNNHVKEMTEQRSVWNGYRDIYDLPSDGSGVCMFALTLSGLSGMETDLEKSLDVYRNYYGMSVESLCIDDIHKEELNKVLGSKHYEGLPSFTSATKSSILTEFERVLKKAIDNNKSTVMFHYLAHGGEDGRIYASDQTFTGEDLAEVISKNYKGKPISSQIDIVIWAGSCYSGKQLDGLKEYFEKRKDIPVRNLRIVTESKYTTAGAGTTPENASLVSDLMTDKSGPLDYYRSWYREYLEYLVSKDEQFKFPAGSYLHEVRFADLMSRYDTYNNQDSIGFHYYSNPEKGINDGRFFTSTNSIKVEQGEIKKTLSEKVPN